MELDQRKIIILKTIIKNYLATGEPVGSRTISRESGLSLSSATIRNEMSDLEEMGYIVQPHTSAGRIPSDMGYRFYVDSILRESDERVSEATSLMLKRVDKLETLLQQMVKLLASDTNYAALVSGPSLYENKIRYLQLSKPSETKLLLILVCEGNIVKNEMLGCSEQLQTEELLNLNLLLNNSLAGLSFREITPKLIAELLVQAGKHRNTVSMILNAVVEMMDTGEEGRDIYTSGATNFFKYPELSDVERASELISAFEEKNELKHLVAKVAQESEKGIDEDNIHGLQVYIGGEGPIRNLQDCSLVTANYELGEGLRGVVGVIGPKRMDYEKVLHSLQKLMDQLNLAFGGGAEEEETEEHGK
ncbi:MAG: heat-inducible transcriptional repressor HrcA [Eubacteriales bacterium]|nr:heat-inducible transcriptional repressor HrcA [Eubacteriales bacterium]